MQCHVQSNWCELFFFCFFFCFVFARDRLQAVLAENKDGAFVCCLVLNVDPVDRSYSVAAEHVATAIPAACTVYTVNQQ